MPYAYKWNSAAEEKRVLEIILVGFRRGEENNHF